MLNWITVHVLINEFLPFHFVGCKSVHLNYSSLCQGSTIAFDYNKKRYWFDVVECRSAPRGEKVPQIKMQDCDVATDFLPSREAVLEKLRKRRERQKQLEEQDDILLLG